MTLSLLLTMLLLTLVEVTFKGTVEVFGAAGCNALVHQRATTLATSSACSESSCCVVVVSYRAVSGGVNYMMRGR